MNRRNFVTKLLSVPVGVTCAALFTKNVNNAPVVMQPAPIETGPFFSPIKWETYTTTPGDHHLDAEGLQGGQEYKYEDLI